MRVFSVRRAACVASSTARDFGLQCGGAFLLLALVTALSLWERPSGLGEEHALRLAAQEIVAASALALCLATLIGCAWSVEEDRRSRRLEQWRATPLRRPEYVAGKILGGAMGAAIWALPLHALLLVLLPQGPLRHAALFAPRPRIHAEDVLLIRDGVQREARQGALLLRSGDGVRFEFGGPSQDLASELSISLHAVGYERYDEGHGPPVLRVMEAGRILLDTEVPLLPGLDARWPVARRQQAVLEVELRSGSFEGSLLLRPSEVYLRGAPTPVLGAVLRSELGVLLLILVAAATATGLAMLLPDVLALLGAGLLVLLSFGRTLLLDITGSVQDFSHVETRAWVRQLSAAGHWLLQGLPGLDASLGSRVLSQSLLPFSGDDPVPWGGLLGWLGGSLAAGVLLARFHRETLP